MLDAYPPEIRDFVLHKIASGDFQSADEFAVEAAILYRELDRRREELVEKLAIADAELQRGEGIVLESEEQLRAFFDEIKAEGRRRLAGHAAKS